MITLNDSHVLFDEETHTYLLDGVILDGITSRIKQRLFPDEYAGVSEDVLAAAAERGHLIHNAIQRCDQEGYVPTEDEMRNEPLLSCVDNYSDLMATNGLSSVANEYLVTDGHTYASPIDIVAEHDGQVLLIDTKTTYTVNKEYVSWQLSVYADFFEAQNPELKVAGLACLWFKVRHGAIEDAQLIDLPRKDSGMVQRMLYTEEPIYSETAAIDAEMAAINAEMVELIREKNRIEARMDALKARTMVVMETNGLTSWKSNEAAYSYRKASTSNRFDSAAFKKAEPDLYKQYTKPCESKATLQVKLAFDAV